MISTSELIKEELDFYNNEEKLIIAKLINPRKEKDKYDFFFLHKDWLPQEKGSNKYLIIFLWILDFASHLKMMNLIMYRTKWVYCYWFDFKYFEFHNLDI